MIRRVLVEVEVNDRGETGKKTTRAVIAKCAHCYQPRNDMILEEGECPECGFIGPFWIVKADGECRDNEGDIDASGN
jgi:hypothetical protein